MCSPSNMNAPFTEERLEAFCFALLRQLDLPIITHLHTIIEEPSAEHLDLMQEFIRLSTRLIVMNKRGRPDLDLRGLQVHDSDLRILEW